MASQATNVGPSATVTEPAKEKTTSVDWQTIVKSEGFPWAVALTVAICALFSGLLAGLPSLWFRSESYYSHGILVPIISGYMLWTRWPELEKINKKPAYLAAILLLPILYITWVAARTSMAFTLSLLFIATIALAVWAIAGWKMMVAALPATLYLLFGLPVWNWVIDRFTQPMQEISAKVSFELLRGMGYQMYRADSVTIMLDQFEMNVGAPCSGLRLMLSLIALMVFFMYIAKLQWWANAFLAVFIIPFAILINGVRIAMIGVVGNTYGYDAGHQFHDYSGYISLVICIIVLQKVCRALGWK